MYVKPNEGLFKGYECHKDKCNEYAEYVKNVKII